MVLSIAAANWEHNMKELLRWFIYDVVIRFTVLLYFTNFYAAYQYNYPQFCNWKNPRRKLYYKSMYQY